MKVTKNRKAILILLFVGLLAASLFCSTVKAPIYRVLYDDWWIANGWNTIYDLTLADDSTNKVVGLNSLNVTVTAHAQYKEFSATLSSPLNFTATSYTYFVFWQYKLNNSVSYRIAFKTDGANFFYFTYTDNYHNNEWDYNIWSEYSNETGWLFDLWTQYGTPDKENITEVSIMINSDNANQYTTAFDFMAFGYDYIDAVPTPSPPPTAAPTPTPAPSPTIPVEYELLIPLIISLFFSILYEVDRKEYLWSGITAMGAWIVSSVVFLIVSSYPVIALIFMAIGLIYLIRLLIDLFRPLNEGRVLSGDSEV